MKYSELFSSQVHQFLIDDTLEEILPLDVKVILKNIGLPLALNHYPYFQTPKISALNNYVLLAYNSLLPNEYIALVINSWELVFVNISETEESAVLYNSSLVQFINCILVQKFIVYEAIQYKLLGDYYSNKNYEQYAEFFQQLLLKIDTEAVQRGVWATRIEEMSYGM
jgi:hypothetical protein